LLGDGRLAANFAVRDSLAPAAQAGLDALARDLYDRFASSSVDPTIAGGAAGLFTDGGIPFDPLAENGFAARIAVNSGADPARGGALWRLRDGLAATAPGPVGDAKRLIAMSAALAEKKVPASANSSGAAQSAAGMAAALLSEASSARLDASDDATTAAARVTAMTDLILADGVDTDDELQQMLLVEKTYSANAQVMRMMDSLLEELMGILR
jgi:flagellar hook-associated protein 1 FlgK